MTRSELVLYALCRYCSAAIVKTLYCGVLLRDAEPQELAEHSKYLRKTGDLAGVVKDLCLSPEHWHKNFDGHASDLVRSIYHGLLGREPESEELQGYAAKLTENH